MQKVRDLEKQIAEHSRTTAPIDLSSPDIHMSHAAATHGPEVQPGEDLIDLDTPIAAKDLPDFSAKVDQADEQPAAVGSAVTEEQKGSEQPESSSNPIAASQEPVQQLLAPRVKIEQEQTLVGTPEASSSVQKGGISSTQPHQQEIREEQKVPQSDAAIAIKLERGEVGKLGSRHSPAASCGAAQCEAS